MSSSNKIANSNHPASKGEKIGYMGQINHPASKTADMISLHQARIARRQGTFIKIAGKLDLYQDLATKDFWKISDDKKSVIRVFDNENGIVKE